jgi:hypothetical protein
VVVVVMLVLIFSERSWAEIAAAPPLEPFEDDTLNFMIAVEFNLGVGFSWWPVMGSLARLTTTPRAALWPNMIGLFAATIVAQVVGLFAALTLGNADPTVWMIPLGGTVLGILALVFVAFANITSMSSIVYSTCLACGRRAAAAPAPALGGPDRGVLPAARGDRVLPGRLYDNFLKFVTWGRRRSRPSAASSWPTTSSCAASASTCARSTTTAALRVLGRVNPGRGRAFVLGFVVYVALFNPQTLRANSPFELISASVPAFLAALLVHVVGTRLSSCGRAAGATTAPSRARPRRPWAPAARQGSAEMAREARAAVLDGRGAAAQRRDARGAGSRAGRGARPPARQRRLPLGPARPGGRVAHADAARARPRGRGHRRGGRGRRARRRAGRPRRPLVVRPVPALPRVRVRPRVGVHPDDLGDCVLPDGTTRLRRGEEAVFPYLALGTFAERTVVPESGAVRIPTAVPSRSPRSSAARSPRASAR